MSQTPTKDQGWLPIETAPKDKTQILVARIVDGQVWWARDCKWSEKWQNWNDNVEPSGLANPTHWMPLSSPRCATTERLTEPQEPSLAELVRELDEWSDKAIATYNANKTPYNEGVMDATNRAWAYLLGCQNDTEVR